MIHIWCFNSLYIASYGCKKGCDPESNYSRLYTQCMSVWFVSFFKLPVISSKIAKKNNEQILHIVQRENNQNSAKNVIFIVDSESHHYTVHSNMHASVQTLFFACSDAQNAPILQTKLGTNHPARKFFIHFNFCF